MEVAAVAGDVGAGDRSARSAGSARAGSPLPKEPPNATWERYYAQHAPAPTLQRIAETLAPRPQVVSALVEAKPLPDNIDEAGVVWAFRA